MNFILKLVLFAACTLIHAPPPAFSFIPIPLMDKECKTSWNIIKICPWYCASKHPGRLLWGLACICCKMQGTTGGTTTAPTSTVRIKPSTETSSTTVSSLDTLRMLLEQLKEEKRLPPVEADNWIERLGSVKKTLLTLDEQIVLTNLLLRAGVPWQTVFTLLRPISEEVPVSKRPPAAMSSSVKPITEKPTTDSDEEPDKASTPTTSDNPASLPSAAPEPSSLPTAETESTSDSPTQSETTTLPTTVSESTTASSTAPKTMTLPTTVPKSTTASSTAPKASTLPTTASDSSTDAPETTTLPTTV